MRRIDEHLALVKPGRQVQGCERIETTLGDLISAIADAANEARVDEHEIAVITQVILRKLKKHPI